MTNQSKLMQDRYGTKPHSEKRRRLIVIALGSALLLLFLIWAISSITASETGFKTQTLGYTIVFDQQATIRVHVESPQGIDRPATCAVQVLNEGYAVVGYREITLPAKFSGDIEIKVNTSKLGVSGSLDKCWFK